jgi:hypothetical protein
MVHKNKKMHDEARTAGVTVIVGHQLGRYVVMKWSEVDKATGLLVECVDGIGADGEPIERLNGDGAGTPTGPCTVTYISPNHERDIYAGDSITAVKTTVEAKTPTHQKLKGRKNVENFTGTRVVHDDAAVIIGSGVRARERVR